MIVASTAAMKLAAMHAARISGRRTRTALGGPISSASDMAPQDMAMSDSSREFRVGCVGLDAQAYDQVVRHVRCRMEIYRVVNHVQSGEHFVYPLLGGPELPEDVIARKQIAVLRTVEWDIEHDRRGVPELLAQSLADALCRIQMLHNATVGDGMERANWGDRRQIEHVAGLEVHVAFRRDRGGIDVGLVHDTRVTIDADHPVTERGRAQRVPARAAAQFQYIAALRHVPQQHLKEDAVIRDPAIDDFAAQLPYVSFTEHFDPIVTVARGVRPNQHAVHLKEILRLNGPLRRGQLLVHMFVTGPGRRITEKSNRMQNPRKYCVNYTFHRHHEIAARVNRQFVAHRFEAGSIS